MNKNNCLKCGYCNRSIYDRDKLVCTKENCEAPISVECANYTKREDGNKYIKVGNGYWLVVDNCKKCRFLDIGI